MKQLLYAVSGYKNSGKTRMIEGIIPYLTRENLKIAVIKHDGHDFEGDVPGTDSYRAMQAGAYATAVFSENRVLIHKECTGMNETQIKTFFPTADIILLEGFKDSDYPKYWCGYPQKEAESFETVAGEILRLYREMDDVNN